MVQLLLFFLVLLPGWGPQTGGKDGEAVAGETLHNTGLPAGEGVAEELVEGALVFPFPRLRSRRLKEFGGGLLASWLERWTCRV